MNIIFFGSDDFAAGHLEALIGARHPIVACVTQPDRAKGRGMKVELSPIKEIALRNKIPILQPEDVKSDDFLSQLKEFSADLFVVIAYGRILPSKVLNLPKVCAINVHGSLLPKYRGAAPINWVIINGEKTTGITIMKLNPKMDAGDIIEQKKIAIDPLDNALTLRKKMMEIAEQLLLKVIKDFEAKRVQFKSQDNNQVTYAAKLTKELGKIQWKKTAVEIHNLVRGLIPWPCAYTFYNQKILKILLTQIVDQDYTDLKPGEIVKICKEGIVVKTSRGSLLIKEVQPESSRKMTAHEFAIGLHLKVKDIFN